MPNTATTTLFIEPLDILILRGNKLFSDAGSHGEALMPPWPSVAAGAIRSRILSDAGIDANLFAKGQARIDSALQSVLGSVANPGSFRIAHFGLARRTSQGAQNSVEALFPLPADVSVNDQDRATMLKPVELHPALSSSYPLKKTPTLLQSATSKAKGGLWLTAAGMRAWQAGEALQVHHWLASDELWALDSRLGIGLEAGRKTVVEGQLYTSEAAALKPGVGFVAQVAGAGATLPGAGLLRFGGDGHAASVRACAVDLPRCDSAALATAGRFRLLLTTPGIFADGWRLPGTDDGGRWHFHGASARVVSAALPRLETLSGWDVARQQPKPALRAVPTGSVYWLDDFQGDAAALDALVEQGLTLDCASRRAEGFNNCLLAEWR